MPVAERGLTFGVADHYVPTRAPRNEIGNPEIARMVRQIDENAAKHRIALFGLNDRRQGIVHVVGPEQGLTLPGLLIVCGDSHTSTHGALGAFAFGIGASEVANVLMTQTIWQRRPKRMRITVDGKTAPGIGAKDIVVAIIAKIGADGADQSSSSPAPPSACYRSKGGSHCATCRSRPGRAAGWLHPIR